jgi:glycosyltransferase involved in cell wall biosynthesis
MSSSKIKLTTQHPIKLSGFTIIRNGVQYDFPFIESIQSMLPIVDECIVNVDPGEDDTLQKIEQLKVTHPDGHKIIILKTKWPLDNPQKKKDGLIFSEQTNEALTLAQGDWCLYLQADEVLHSKDYPVILKAISEAQDQSQVEGLVFKYCHFYGSYQIVQESRAAYRREVRIIRNRAGIINWGDAQSFRKQDGTKIFAKLIDATIYHYGWVKPPVVLNEKKAFQDSLHHAIKTDWVPSTYEYERLPGLKKFVGTHPEVMSERVKNQSWQWDPFQNKIPLTRKNCINILLNLIEKITGYRLFEYKCYKLLK